MIHPIQLRLMKLQTDAANARKLLRRVRLLYIRIVWMHVLTDPTQDSLDRAVLRMRDSGMYASTTGERQIRYTILRRCWTLETGKNRWRPYELNGWHDWYQRHGFQSATWVKTQNPAQRVA